MPLFAIGTDAFLTSRNKKNSTIHASSSSDILFYYLILNKMPEKSETDKKADKGIVYVPLRQAHLLDAGCLPKQIEGGKFNQIVNYKKRK